MLDHKAVKSQIARALEEDIGDGDLTARLIDPKKKSVAQVICRENAVLCGTAWFDEVFRQCDPSCQVTWMLSDGDEISPNQTVCEIHGSARAMVTAERTALNFLQTLSATATVTKKYVAQLAGTKCKLLDTRKTIPLLRDAQKYAVVCGGGVNHRVGLYDGILIKENHIEAAGSVKNAIQQMRTACPGLQIETEVEDLAQLEHAITSGADIVLLDNFSVEQTQAAVELSQKLSNGKVKLEASGGFEFADLPQVAATGVDFISVGGLTKHVRAIDFSMRFVS